jgi:hypothetical protein
VIFDYPLVLINSTINNLKKMKMKKVKLIIAALLMTASFGSYAQTPEKFSTAKVIAVVNRANWCGVCKANGARFGAVLMPYAEKGLNIYMNDLTNDSTKFVSRTQLEKANVYETVNTIPRKGMGKALKACHIVKDKKQTQDVAGIVTFIDASSHKQLKQVSISVSDQEMNTIITKLLN